MLFQDIFERNCGFLAASDAFQCAFGLVKVFEVVEVFKDGLADVERFGAAGAAGKFLEALFDGLGKPNGQHRDLAIQV
jgi:hypothetical protein